MKSKARVLLGIFMLSGMLGQVSTFYASGRGGEKLPHDDGRLAITGISDDEKKHDEELGVLRLPDPRLCMQYRTCLRIGLRRCICYFFNRPSYSLSDEDRDKGNTMLHVAASKGDTETLAYILDKWEYSMECGSMFQAGLYVKNKDGNTPLHVAVENGQFNAVQFIVRYMIMKNVNPSEDIPNISSDLSNRNEYPYGIDFNFEHYLQLRNNDGKTALDLARSQLSYNVVRVTELAGAVKHTDIVENVCGMLRYNSMIDYIISCLKISKITDRYSNRFWVTEEDENELVNSITKDTADLFIGDTFLIEWAKQHGCEKLVARLRDSDVYDIVRKRLICV